MSLNELRPSLLRFKVQFPRLYRKFEMTQYHQLFGILWLRPSVTFMNMQYAHVFRIKLKPLNDSIAKNTRGDTKFLHEQTTGSE